jgi:short-subunit dehydrogenase
MSFNESVLNDLLTHYKDCSIKTTLVLPGILNTELFKNAKTPSNFLLPNQDAKELSDKIVKELEVHRHSEIYSPKYVNLVPWYRVFNLTFRRYLHTLIGADAAMYNFNTK